MRIKFLTKKVISITIFPLILTSCLNGSSSSPTASSTNTVNISGAFGNSYSYNRNPILEFIFTSAYAGFGKVNNIIAIPVSQNYVAFEFAKKFNVNSDGTFSLNLEKYIVDEQGINHKVSWIMLIDRSDGKVDFLSIQSNNDSLINFPVGDFSNNNFDLGNIENIGDEGVSNISVNDLPVNLDVESLSNLVKFDDIVKSAVNIYINNYNKPQDEWIMNTLHVVSSGDYNKINTSYSIASNFEGYAFHIHANPNNTISKNFSYICNNTKILELYPSGTISAGGQAYDSNNPLKSNGSQIQNRTDGGQECRSGNFYIRKDSNGDTTINFITGDNKTQLANTIPIPQGYFELKLDNQVIGKFEYSYSLPLTTDGKLKLPIPSIKLDLDNNNRVLGIYVKWYFYNEDTKNYEEITNLDSIQWLIPVYSIHMNDFNGITTNGNRLEISCDSIPIQNNYVDIVNDCNFNGEIYYNYNNEDKYSLDDVNVAIKVYDNEYRFTYRKP